METSMIYELRSPKSVISGKKYSAIFVMHGMGSNEHDLLPLLEGLDDVFIFSIRGPLSQGPGYAYFTIQGFGNPDRKVFDASIKKLSEFIEFAVDKYPLDANQLYLLGFSQGAIVSMTLALTLPINIKGVVALSGYIPKFVKEEYKVNPSKNLSVFISHGEYDNALPFEWGKDNVDFFTKLSIPVTFKSYPVGHGISEQNYQDFRAWLLNDLKR